VVARGAPAPVVARAAVEKIRAVAVIGGEVVVPLAAERELEAAQARGEALQRLEHDRDALMEAYAGMVREVLEDLAPEERYRIYKLLRLGVRFRPDWPLEITGVFAEVGEEAETGLSDSKPSPLSV